MPTKPKGQCEALIAGRRCRKTAVHVHRQGLSSSGYDWELVHRPRLCERCSTICDEASIRVAKALEAFQSRMRRSRRPRK